jgi:lipoate-protein ligase A
LREYAGTLEQALGYLVGFEEAAAALAQGFEYALNLRLEPGELTDYERNLAERLRLTQYASVEWSRRM